MYRTIEINLTTGRVSREDLPEDTRRQYLGGAGIGIKLLYEAVPPHTVWSDENNLLIFATGPLNGTSVPGSGTICAITKGCLTNGGASSQANGYFGAYLRSLGIDALIIRGIAEQWKYLHIRENKIEIKDARHLIGKDTIDVEVQLKEELGKKEKDASVYSIGPAGENLVRYAMISGDRGHVIAHNGFGTVMGSKRLKSIVVDRGHEKPFVNDPKGLSALSKAMGEQARAHPVYGRIHKYGTSMLWPMLAKNGILPVKNLTTNIFHGSEKFSREYYGPNYEMKRIGCWACSLHHVQHMKMNRGLEGQQDMKDPEYECSAAWSSLIGNDDFESAVFLSDLTDRLGMDANEAGWVISFAIECYEKGILTKKDTDGIEMTWGNVESVENMLLKIACRDGFGDLLAQGVKQAAETIGGEALNIGVYLERGHSPRTHDARARWGDILDYATGSMGTSESNSVASDDPFNPGNVAQSVVSGKIREFVDSLVVCNIATMSYMGTEIGNLIKALNLVTGWDYTEDEAVDMSLRVINHFRVFNLRCGHRPDQERPSVRYSSTAVDGPAKGKGIEHDWDEILEKYYRLMGWDRVSGRPLPETLKKFGLEYLIADIW
ncbi:aldehyde ferredoxin oxidoreductase C-terminal domain-containing protein [Desulfobacula sp.]|uniref:aldehyde ferredoxin oxidoreductase family protein n=1 Tax=Desulfobacula sp. TaxID=2593537 RepID=UPI00262D3549|nr:aldehyde ferredoxin oxidoreductase C-terminal domain-containing protein [Desulfobacula sp.]